MNQYDYFNSEFYPRKISVSDIVDFLKNQISPDQEISSDELLQKIEYNDISDKEISINELAKFINKKRFPDIKKAFLLENFNRIIDAQRKRDKKSKSYSRRAFLDKYFGKLAPESEDTLAKWCKDEPKKESSRLKLLFAFDKMSVASEMFNDYFLKTVLEEQISKHVMKGENSKEDSLEVAMLCDIYNLTHLLLPSLKILDNSVGSDLNQQIKREVEKNLGTRLNKNSYTKEMSIINNILKEISDDNLRLSRKQFDKFLSLLSSKGYVFDLNYPSEIELIDKFLNITKEQEFSMEWDDFKPNKVSGYIIHKNKFKGLKNHRLYCKSPNSNSKYWKTELPRKNVFKDKRLVLDGKGKKKVSKEVIQTIKKTSISSNIAIVKQKFCINLIYKSNKNINLEFRQLPKFSNNTIRKGKGILKDSRALVDVEYNQWFHIINFFYNVNVTIKDRTIKIKVKSLSKLQKEYNHFKVSGTYEKLVNQNSKNFFDRIKEYNHYNNIY
jgi:hypothetical protein